MATLALALPAEGFQKGDRPTLEAVFTINPTTLRADCGVGATSIQVRSVEGWIAGDILRLNHDEETAETVTIQSISGTTVTLTAGTAYAHREDEAVVELEDPTTITLKERTPTGTTNTYTYAGATITRASKGVYRRNVSLNADGVWAFRWEGTGTVEEASPDIELHVNPTRFL